MEQFFFKINLNKFGEERLKAQKEKRQYVNFCLVFLAMFLLVTGFTILNISNLDTKIDTRKGQLVKLKAEIKEYDNVMRITDSKNLEKDMERFAEAYNKRIFWTRKLQALEEITSDNLAISKFSFKSGAWELVGLIKAKTKDVPQDIINTYRDSLVRREEFNDFKSVEFVNRDLVKKILDVESTHDDMDVIYDFKIKCLSKYKKKK